MDNSITKALFYEKERLEKLVNISNERLKQIYKPALVENAMAMGINSDRIVSYIDLDKLTLEQRDQFDRMSKICEEQRAKLCVFNYFVKSNVIGEKTTDDPYVDINLYKDTNISCSDINVDENGNFIGYSMKVTYFNAACPKNMTINEYAKIYMSYLTSILVKGTNPEMTQEEKIQNLKDACSEVYLGQIREFNKTK